MEKQDVICSGKDHETQLVIRSSLTSPIFEFRLKIFVGSAQPLLWSKSIVVDNLTLIRLATTLYEE